MERRLAAIFAADVVGYSRLIRADEEGTLAAFNALRAEIIDPLIADHHGRVFKLMGDGLLAEFASVVDAVRAGAGVQRAMAEHNAVLPQDKRIEFRIGINLGDVVIDGDDIHGDGVNVAARLEGLAEPGGIYISEAVYEQVRDRIDLPFEDLGEQEVKNIDRPVHIWRWVREAVSPLLAVTGGENIRPLLQPDKLSVAVLPFQNMSGDPEQEYFSDGISEDIITALSRVRWFFVTARNSSFSYKGHSPDVRQVAKDLGVRYVLEGSVRKSANRVRITAQLVDGHTGNHIWADRYDRELADVFAVQDEITQVVVGTIEPELSRAEQERARIKAPENMDVWETYQRGMWYAQLHEVEEFPTAEQFLRRAIKLDPNLGPAYAALSEVLGRKTWGTDARGETLKEAVTVAQTAVQLDPSDAAARCALGRAHFLSRNHDRAATELRKAIDLNPSYAHAHFSLGATLLCSGEAEASISHLELARRLSPRDYLLGSMMGRQAQAHLLMKQYDQAVEWGKRSVEEDGSWLPNYIGYMSALGHLGHQDEARKVYESMRAIKQDISIAYYQQRWPMTNQSDIDLAVEGLRKAGLPEQ